MSQYEDDFEALDYAHEKIALLEAKLGAAGEVHEKDMAEAQFLISCLQEENKKLERALKNCYMIARRRRLRSSDENWDHIIRFCEEIGQKPSILREGE